MVDFDLFPRKKKLGNPQITAQICLSKIKNKNMAKQFNHGLLI